ncbi:MAG: LacI family DNA-binding transcriptional regulator [Verrucomicrobia bacterium]|nr:LacI family DNA-binding transcriptional regulator [Verrucomicrobiota bacterium]MDA1088526.1 LacI family DNA-binding transcriptional regulator [Verrucomicrobiota bacterium]
MALTQKDLAARLNISQVTVSRALRGEVSVKPALRKRIIKEAEQAGYSIQDSNFEARRMRQRAVGAPAATNVICALVHDEDDSLGFGGRILRGMNREADAIGMEIVMMTHYNASLPRIVARGQVDGVVRLLGDIEFAKGLPAMPMPWVSILYDVPQADLITVDNFTGMRDVGRHICSHGHQRIAFIGPDTHIARDRLSGLRAAAQESDAEIPDELVCMEPHSADEVATKMYIERLMADGTPSFTALVAYNDYMAEFAMKEFRSRGLRVPEEISVAGFDGVLPSRLHEHTQITTAAIPLEDLGAAAVRRLQQRIKSPDEARKKIMMDATFVEGETVADVSTQ